MTTVTAEQRLTIVKHLAAGNDLDWVAAATKFDRSVVLVITRLDRLAEEELKARAEKVHLQTLRELPGRSSTARPAAH